MRGLLLTLLLPILLPLGLAPAPADPGAPAMSPGFTNHGRFITDADGRAFIVAGINMVDKRAPYRADAVGFGDDDAAFLAANGFNAVRLGVIWKAVEPQPGVYDDTYLAHIRDEIQTLSEHGIATLVDFHQDLYNEVYQGEGAPDWAVLPGGPPNAPKAGFPANQFINPATMHAYDNFWSNAKGPGGVGLADRYAAAWAHAAQYLKGEPGVMGLDIYNEPWPGTLWATCIPIGCPALDARIQKVSQKVIDAVRQVDADVPIYYEPNSLFNDGISTYVKPTGTNLGFSFHDYCLTSIIGSSAGKLGDLLCDATDTLTWSNAERQLTRTGATPLLTEFGATTLQQTLTGMVDRAATHRLGWMYWAYCGCDDPTTTGAGDEQALVFDPAKPPTGDNVDQAKLTALAVPHPSLVSGTPTAYAYNRSSHVFTATWTTEKAAGGGSFATGAQTTIAAPAVAYPNGYTVQVRGGQVVSAADADTVVVEQSAGATSISVTVSPR